MNAIEITNLKKTYANGTVALREINLTIKKGEFCALLGANGAGKTTIIGILTGLVQKTDGNVKAFDIDITQNPTGVKELLGIVPQEMNFNMFEKVQDIIVTQAGLYGIPRAEATKHSETLLKQLKLWDKRDTISRNLSGGMKRRLMIARALINNPKILILDEPTAGVDVELRHSMWKFLKELNEQGTTILLTTHYLEEVEQLCRQAAIIKQGKIIKDDSVKDLLKLVERETYVIHTNKSTQAKTLEKYSPKIIDPETFEIDLHKDENLHDFINELSKINVTVTDIRPKGNRIEKLYLSILDQNN